MTIAYPKPRGRNHQKQVLTCSCGTQFYRNDPRGNAAKFCKECKANMVRARDLEGKKRRRLQS